VGKRKKIRGARSWLNTAAALALAAAALAIFLGHAKAGSILIIIAGMIAFIASEVSEHPYESPEAEDPDRRGSRDETSHDAPD
jgi:hypothetical protein